MLTPLPPPPIQRAEKACSPPHKSCRIRNNPPLVIVVKSNCATYMLCNDCRSLETFLILNEDSIKEDNVLDNTTYLSVSQYFNQNLRSPLYCSALAEFTWFFLFCNMRKLILNIFRKEWGCGRVLVSANSALNV